jgi:hypothetical protein
VPARRAATDDLLQLVQRFFPKETFDARRTAIIGQFAKNLSDAPATENPG